MNLKLLTLILTIWFAGFAITAVEIKNCLEEILQILKKEEI